MTMPDRIKVPTAFWLGVDRLKVGRSTVLRVARLPTSAGHNEAPLSTSQFFSLWRALEELHGDDVGLHLAHGLEGAVMPPSFMVAYHARDLRDALHRVARFKSLCSPEELTVSREGDAIVIDTAWPYAQGDVPFSLIDATMTSLIGLARSSGDAHFQPLRIELRRPRSQALLTHYDCPVRWKAEKDRLFLRTSDLDLPFKTYNAELVDLLDAALSATLETTASALTLSEQVQWLLRRSITAGRPEMRSVARELAISERSLQRRLHEEGHTFQSLLSDTRRDLAREYLANSKFDISEIAYMLGYDDQGSFYRAFQKWENHTPSEWRQSRTACK